MRNIITAVTFSALLWPSSLLGQDPAAPETSLHVAVLAGDVEAVRRHVAAGTDLDAKDPYGSTPLIIAATFDRPEAARILMDGGADLDLTNAAGGTALHTAAFLCRTEIVRDLLAHGARKYLRDHAGNTPEEAVSGPFEEVRGTYESIQEGLRPLGLVLDFAEIERTRPRVAEMLRPEPDELDAVDYAPDRGGDWEVSTPEAQGLDRASVAELFLEAADREALFGLVIVKNGRLVAEGYFNGGSRERKELMQSVTKSFTSALVGIALDRGCLEDVDRKMLDFFPEVAARVTDPRKREITLRQMLQMRAGYPWEETDSTYWNALLTGDYLPLVAEIPLTADPGATFQYSNLTSHWLGVVVSRACGTDLRSFAGENLFGPLGVEPGPWVQDRAGYFMGHAELRITARDAARFGLLYLNDGELGGRQVVPADWVAESLRPYSRRFDSGGVHDGRVGRYHRDVGYGYQWWSARAGAHRFDYAWGHGGQFIVLLDDLDMVIVLTSEPFYVQHDAESWRSELANLNLVGRFIESLPTR